MSLSVSAAAHHASTIRSSGGCSSNSNGNIGGSSSNSNGSSSRNRSNKSSTVRCPPVLSPSKSSQQTSFNEATSTDSTSSTQKTNNFSNENNKTAANHTPKTPLTGNQQQTTCIEKTLTQPKTTTTIEAAALEALAGNTNSTENPLRRR